MTDFLETLREEAATQVASPLYLKTVTELGDERPLVTNQEIYSTTGIKLVNKGARFNSKLFDHLVHHKLIPSLDQCVSIENPVTVEDIAQQASNMLASDERFVALAARFPQTGAIVQVLAQAQLNPAMIFKLSVMRDKHPALLQHSIYVAIVSTYIGIRAGLPDAQLAILATAALLHDIGILHIDQKLFDRSHVLTEQQRRHLYAHPVTAHLILSACPEYGPELLNAVLDHHERLDGSGYPRGLRGNAISRLGQMIALAEIVASRHEKPDEGYGSIRLGTILKLNSQRYGREHIGYLDLFYKDQDAALPSFTPEQREIMRKRMRDIAEALKSWRSAYAHFRGSHQAVDFIHARISGLQVAVLDAGFDPDQANTMGLDAEDDPRACVEMGILTDEVFWQIKGLLQEIQRRWPLIEQEDKTSTLHPIANWITEVKSLFS